MQNGWAYAGRPATAGDVFQLGNTSWRILRSVACWREANAASWRELTLAFRRLEARGEIRGGRFVSSMTGERRARGGEGDYVHALTDYEPSAAAAVVRAWTGRAAPAVTVCFIGR